MTAEQTVAWEADNRSRVTRATVGAAALLAIGAVVGKLALRPPNADDKIVTVLDALRDTAAGQAVPPGRLAEHTIYLGEHAALPIVGSVIAGLGTLLLFPVLAYLFRATRARRPALPQVALISAAAGTVAYAIGHTVAVIASAIGATGFVDKADHSNSAASDAVNGSIAIAGQLIGQIGALVLAVAIIVIALNAMRVGLLTRFMGVIGVIVGVSFIVPLDQFSVLTIFWLISLAMVLAGRVRNLPPAWASGKAEPWPSQQQLREQRDAARADAEPAAPAPAVPAPAPAQQGNELPAAGAPTPRADGPGQGRRKRKRR